MKRVLFALLLTIFILQAHSETATWTWSAIIYEENSLSKLEEVWNYIINPNKVESNVSYQDRSVGKILWFGEKFSLDQLHLQSKPDCEFANKSTEIPTAVDDISASADEHTEYYTLQDIMVNHPEKDLYICRQGNKVQKIFVP